MVKIEKLSDAAVVWFVRNGVRQRAFLHQLISHSELETLEVETGTVMYSIDEQETFMKSAAETKSPGTETPATTVEPPTPSVAETPAPAKEVVKPAPKIVYPAKTTKKR